MPISLRGKTWRVVSGDLMAEIDLAQGGKIRALRSRASRRNFFFQDPRRAPRGRQYLEHDISGWDECFPTVGKSPARYGADHGVLWSTPWEGYCHTRQFVSRVSRPQGMPIILTRVISPNGPNCILFDYTLVNLGKQPLTFIYSSHPILAPDRRTRVRLPGVTFLSVLGHNGLLKSGSRHAWPAAVLKNGKSARLDTDFSAQRKIAGKWFVAGIASAEVTFPETRESLRLTWDQENLPSLGYWISLGLPLDPAAPQAESWRCLALEPCTDGKDVLDPAAAGKLSPGQSFSFWIQWELCYQRSRVKTTRRKLVLKRLKRILRQPARRTGQSGKAGGK